MNALTAFLLALLVVPVALGQTPFQNETEFLVRDGGRWIADNPGGTPAFYGQEFAWDYDQNGAPNVMVYKVFGITADGDSLQYWQGLAGWEPIAQQVTLRQYGSFSFTSEAMATGTEVRIDPNTTELTLAVRYRGGLTRTIMDRSIVTGPDAYTVEVYENGQQISENQWQRVPTATTTEPPTDAPERSALQPPYPNPGHRAVTIPYELETAAVVHLEVLDVQGRRIRTLLADTPQAAGPHTAIWDGTDEAGRPVAAGVYLYRLKTPEHAQTRTVTLVR